uniref:beta-L-arabinofuranosidase domain-containing protein n=1 Tax=Thaumasiovibrio occultus TaxID=1891184 RepID=UPI000B35FB94|nr:beta-L-arabinofuranosidase domain-containing protein [Thaumasiovibrio occultus]
MTALPHALTWLPSRDTQPLGWIAHQMHHDLHHSFVGHLDQLVPDLIIHDDIYHQHRRTLADKAKDVGAIAQDADWEVQYLWWNAETQSNWWDGFVRHAMTVGSDAHKQKVTTYIERILASQDSDGYLGIYGTDLRFQAKGENGELWAQAALLRTLIAYYEFTQDTKVYQAIVAAVACTMKHWPINNSTPFNVTEPYAGVGHGLVFTDVLDWLYCQTREQTYLDYAKFLYTDYCRYQLCDNDIQLHNLLDPSYNYQGHAVHTWEHLRPLLTAQFAADDSALNQGMAAFMQRLPNYLTPSGAPIGDEFILGKKAHATEVGYEYCSLQELLDAYTHLLQKTGDLRWGDAIEKLLFNAAQGARHPDGMGIAYLKTDNSYSMTGDAGCHCQGNSAHQVQTRYKYSPTHQEAAVCCVPNAGRIYPYFVKAMWLQEGESTLVKALYGPSELRTVINGAELVVKETSNYPAEHTITLEIASNAESNVALKCRIPQWATGVRVDGADCTVNENFVTLQQDWQGHHRVTLHFIASPVLAHDQQGEAYATFGPLVYGLSIPATESVDKNLAIAPFQERCYQTQAGWVPVTLPTQPTLAVAPSTHSHQLPWQQFTPIETSLGFANEQFVLAPMASSILRQVTFGYQQ